MSDTKERILVSACLLGMPCRYDGKSVSCQAVLRQIGQAELVPVCPEILGGLPTPRTPAERRGDAVVTRDGRDVTAEYLRGAQEALRLARLFGCTRAILKSKSPSCGCGPIYDGSFSGRLIPGEGVAAQLLRENGIEVCDEAGRLQVMGDIISVFL